MRHIDRIITIAKHEYWVNVRRWEFLALTFGLPVFFAAVAGISALPMLLVARRMPQRITVGIIDDTKRFQFPHEIKGFKMPGQAGRFVPPIAGYRFIPFATVTEAENALRSHAIDSYLHIPKDYVDTGRIDIKHRPAPSSFLGNLDSNTTPPVRSYLIKGLLKGQVSDKLLQRVLDPIRTGPTQTRRASSNDASLRFISRFVIPYAFVVLLVVSIFMSSGYLLRGISDEKEGRIIEIMLSSVSAQQLFVGKLLGLSAVGLTQVLIWVGLGGAPTAAFLAMIKVPWGAALLAPVYFLLGFFLYGAMMAGIGALGGSWRESQQLSAVISVFAVLPIMFFPVLADEPNGTLSTVLSLIPLCTPLVMIVRLSITSVSWVQIVASIVLTTLTILGVIKVSVKLFRTAMLMQGKSPGVREVLRWLRQS